MLGQQSREDAKLVIEMINAIAIRFKQPDIETFVERYKSCIQDFIDEQEDEIENHRDAANYAIDEWNSFASSL